MKNNIKESILENMPKTFESDIILAPSTFNINIEKFIDIQQSSGIVVGDQNVVHMEENAKRLIEDPKGKN